MSLFLHIKNGVKAILKVSPHDIPEIDEEITFSVPYEQTYVFDGETEQVICG